MLLTDSTYVVRKGALNLSLTEVQEHSGTRKSMIYHKEIFVITDDVFWRECAYQRWL